MFGDRLQNSPKLVGSKRSPSPFFGSGDLATARRKRGVDEPVALFQVKTRDGIVWWKQVQVNAGFCPRKAIAIRVQDQSYTALPESQHRNTVDTAEFVPHTLLVPVNRPRGTRQGGLKLLDE
jgi:hypothetical protein